MFFTRAAIFIAYLLFVLGSIRVALGAFFAATAEDNAAAAGRFFAAATTGEAINEGTLAIFAGVCLGVLAEISKALQSK